MATPPLSELEPLLASLNTHKAPGASKAKIGSLTKIAVNNIEHEQQITQSLYRALKKAPATHKLGVLYVIDSIIRQWIDGAKKAGLDIHIEGRGEAGTYPAAIKRVTELMPALIDDLLKDLPADQKPKLENILAIWERAGTFPTALLEESKRKVSTPAAHVNGSGAAPVPSQTVKKPVGEKSVAPVPTRPTHTPVGFPPQHLYDQGFLVRKGDSASKPASSSAQQVAAPAMQNAPLPQPAPAAAPPSQDVNSILAALRMAAPPPQQQPVVQPAAPLPTASQSQLPPNFAAMLGSANGFAQPPAPPQQQQQSYPPPPAQFQPPPFMPPGFQPPPGFPAFLPPPPSVPPQYALAPPPPQQVAAPADPLAALRGVLPPNIVNDQQKLIRALNLLQELQKEGVPMDQWGPVIQALDEQSSPPQQSNQYNGYNGHSTSRGRSRSPNRGGNNNGRGSPVYNAYNGPTEDQRNGRNGNNRDHKQRYRQRSPLRASPLPPSFQPPPPSGQKFVQFDPTLPSDSIRVLSRTLFVGGANGSQTEIAELFGRFGQVASCIPNREKRHAFVKMTTRDYTLAAKAGVDALQSANDRETMGIARQVKWGVGFGPRECFDYTRGESVIPIQRLTDADMKWIKTAPYGGTGGQELVAGMVLEEPDIEIGAGVSSKAMSRRVGPGEQEKGSVHHQHQQQQQQAPVQQFQQQQQQQQPKRQDHKHGGGGGKRGRHGHHNRDDVGGYGGGAAVPQGFVRPEPLTPVAVATPPAVPGFGFTLPGNFR